MHIKKILKWSAITIVSIGGINWGLIGLANFNLVNAIFGSYPILEKIIYILVGISTVYSLFAMKKK